MTIIKYFIQNQITFNSIYNYLYNAEIISTTGETEEVLPVIVAVDKPFRSAVEQFAAVRCLTT